MDKRSSKRNKKSYYKKMHQSRLKMPSMDEFFSGFLVTCNERRERDAVRDFYKLLDSKTEDLYDILDQAEKDRTDEFVRSLLIKRNHNQFNSQKQELSTTKQNIENEVQPKDKEDKMNQSEAPNDILNEMPSEQNKNVEIDVPRKEPKFPNKFQQIKINKKGILFFRLNEFYEDKINLLKISGSIMQDFFSGNTTQYTNLFRITPVEVCSFASFGTYEKYLPLLFDSYIPKEGQFTVCLFYKCRNNSKFTKTEFIDLLNEKKPENCKVIEYKADFTVFVDIVQVKLLNYIANLSTVKSESGINY